MESSTRSHVWFINCRVGTSKDVVADATFQPARRSASRKQLQFAPIQLGRVSEQPQKSAAAQGFEDELMSPGRSKSLGSAVDRALLKSAVDSELAVSKDRPHSATQFSRQVSTLPVCKQSTRAVPM